MLTTSHAAPIWTVRFCTLLLALATGASAAYWWLKLPGAELESIAAPLAAQAAITDTSAVALALGHSAKAAAPSRFTLLGVVADTRQAGSALIAVDGQAAKAFAVGATVAPGWMLKSVQGRMATLASDGNTEPVTLQMAPLPVATLP